MELQYWGTAASEGWPALFCDCEACRTARALGGKNIRTRSQALVDNTLLLDFPADTYWHSIRYNTDLSCLKNILITHSHEDHLYPLDLILKATPYAHGGAPCLTIYGNDVVTAMIRRAMEQSAMPEIGQFLHPVTVEPFCPFAVEDYTVTALPADHIPEEKCYLYLIRHGDKTLLYAHDTGIFPDATWRYLKAQQLHLDAVSIDCTFVLRSNERGHLGLPNVLDVRKHLTALGCTDERTFFIINHFSHNVPATHEELSAEAGKYGILTAYDGMTVTF